MKKILSSVVLMMAASQVSAETNFLDVSINSMSAVAFGSASAVNINIDPSSEHNCTTLTVAHNPTLTQEQLDETGAVGELQFKMIYAALLAIKAEGATFNAASFHETCMIQAVDY
ncbi:hypothetical protein EDC56_1232 [Sinobacterium caligoides]|uniref:Uncharacterized protein n=1 Tax=Sinobacterium caligoides TaxID=933926 RepID=A0A3N2E281_9GAMM|nr:hypothetical protein [Sinobacterium caligoides]ROS05685.1 hypothetical protein EDC56_1232 [Sinobacterium caligoides]